MSNVLARNRGITEMEFYRVADDLRAEISVFLMSDKNIPKKWRSIFTYPILNMIQDMFDCIVEANDTYPYTDAEVEERKRLQKCCIEYCEKVFERLQYAMRVIWWDTLQRDENNTERRRLEYHLIKIGEMLDREEALLKGWRKSTKLLQRRQ